MNKSSLTDDHSKATRTMSFQWTATPEDLQRILDAAAKGKLDRIPIEVADRTVFLSIDEITIAPVVAGEAPPQSWKRREQNRFIQVPNDAEQGNSR